MKSQNNFDKKFQVAENYKKIREFRLKSQDDVVKYLSRAIPENEGIKQNVSSWENLKSNPGKTFIYHLVKFLAVPKEIFHMDSLTKEYLEKHYSTPNNTHMDKVKDNTESPDPEEDFRKLVEGKTEYLLIPRSVLHEKYRLVSLEQIEKDRIVVDKLLDTIDILASKIPSEFPRIKETQKNA